MWARIVLCVVLVWLLFTVVLFVLGMPGDTRTETGLLQMLQF